MAMIDSPCCQESASWSVSTCRSDSMPSGRTMAGTLFGWTRGELTGWTDTAGDSQWSVICDQANPNEDKASPSLRSNLSAFLYWYPGYFRWMSERRTERRQRMSKSSPHVCQAACQSACLYVWMGWGNGVACGNQSSNMQLPVKSQHSNSILKTHQE